MTKIQTTSAKTLYVGNPGNYTNIQDAIDNASDGDTIFIFNEVYNETINIAKNNLTIIGEDVNNTIINANATGNVVNITANNITISNLTVTNANNHGIYLELANNIEISNCTIEGNNGSGILINSSNNNTIVDCYIESNSDSGIIIDSSDNNKISDCDIYNNGGSGILIDSSKYNTISTCYIDYNDGSGVFVKSSDSNTVTDDCIIECNGEYGILIYAAEIGESSDSNLISNCEICYNDYCGIRITNKFEIGGYSSAIHNKILECEFYDNGDYGGQDHTKAALSISPEGNGIVTNTTVSDCIFYFSNGYDVHIEGGYLVENNTFYNNSFLSSYDNVYDEQDSIWYNSNLSRGNYWACYDEENEGAYDDYDPQGIIDDPYDIPGGDNQDLYPLADPEYLGLFLPIAEVNGPYNAYTDASITFDATGSYDPDSSYLIYEWDLGNGDTIYGKTVSYAYPLKGDYTVTLTVEDDYGLTGTNTTTATITDKPEEQPPPPPPKDEEPENKKPTADVGGPYFGFAGVALLFDGSDSNDIDGTSLTYKWNFGDGGTSSARMPTHTYSEDGNYTVTLTVTDEDGAKDSDSTYALISKKPNNPPDKPVVSGITEGHINTSLNLSVNGSDEDGDLIQYIFNWSDGTNDTVSPLLESGTMFNTSHNFTTGGIYVITVSIKDKNNATSDVQPFKVMIDSHSCGSLGYLVDKDGNGVYDVFYRESTGKETRVEQDGDDYNIDINGDEKWDYIYNFATDKVQDYSYITAVKNEDSFTLELKWVLLILIIVAVSIYLIASNTIYKARNGKKTHVKKKKKKKPKKEKKKKIPKEKKSKKIPIAFKRAKEKPVKMKKIKKIKIKKRKRIKVRRKKKTYAFDPKARKMKKMHKNIDKLLSEKKLSK